MSWVAFLPVALAFGQVIKHHSVHTAGWILTGLAGLSGLWVARRHRQGNADIQR
jgi:hypothetical protein